VKRKWKIWLIVIAVVVVTVGALVAKGYSQRGIVVVQTGGCPGRTWYRW